VSRLLVLVLALTALVASSCGGGGGNKPLSKSEYEAQIGAILRPLQERTLREALAASPADPKHAVTRLKTAETALHDDADKLAKMKPPSDAAGPTSQIAQALGRIADRVTAIRKDAEKGNFARLEQFKVQIAADPSVRQIRDAIIQLVNLGYDVAGAGP
jgi:hypothetical protein